ncbi:MAG: RnfABCDGE type electron transport complex subunit G [Lachnospiraceae bacterium]|nr:RnfABCDGE type electron transport complex subunit G [Lachnospiraceae bacterium]
MLKDAGILFAITLIAGLVLGFVYELTKEPIRVQEELAVQRACQAVFAAADNFEEQKYVPTEDMQAELDGIGVEIGTIYEAKDASGNSLGYVVETTSTEGYGGDITLYAGITKEGMLNGISILSIAETPGLGMNAESVLVPQFENVEATFFYYTKSGSTADDEIDAISGATITTEAVINAVNGAVYVIQQDFMKGGN